MARHYSFVAINVEPISQNSRRLADVLALGGILEAAHNTKAANLIPPGNTMTPIPNDPLLARVYYIHKIEDKKDADNISKPLWDSLNKRAYPDDRSIKYLETLKVHVKAQGLHELDVTYMDDKDFDDLIDFLVDPRKQRFLYVEISDLQFNKVRF